MTNRKRHDWVNRRVAGAPRRVAPVFLALALLLGGCDVHKLSVNDSRLDGTWQASWEQASGPAVVFEAVMRREGDALTGYTRISRGDQVQHSDLSGTVADDSLVTFSTGLINRVAFTGVWRDRYELRGDLEFDFLTGRESRPGTVLEKTSAVDR